MHNITQIMERCLQNKRKVEQGSQTVLTERLKRLKVDGLYSEDWDCIVENPLWSDEEDREKYGSKYFTISTGSD